MAIILSVLAVFALDFDNSKSVLINNLALEEKTIDIIDNIIAGIAKMLLLILNRLSISKIIAVICTFSMFFNDNSFFIFFFLL